METSALTILWFVLIAVLWSGYLVLEGFDFGVGMLTSILPAGDERHKESERRVLINTIGPVWDGNEVWLLTAGGATFAAFPEWYATLFEGFYLPLLLILLALILRGVAFEYRGKLARASWVKAFDAAITVGSWLPALLWGVAFANLVRGLELTQDGFAYHYTGGFWALLNPFALLGGVTTLVLFALHGTIYVSLKTSGAIRDRAAALSSRLSVAALVVAGAWAVWAQVAYSRNAWTWAAVVVAALALVAVVWAAWTRRAGLAFIGTAVTLVAAVVLIFGAMYPYALAPLAADGVGLHLATASSTHLTLVIMTWVAVLLTPVVLAYTAWTYWVFRRRLSTADLPAPAALSWSAAKSAFATALR
ncbi:cytochrome d ubiquinol oxidase subunit II [Xylanimonas ulmi]|uniref:Cytochrome bd-I ubiquinol oxidase subunit 2 apoprotein n=1 Tax=Xylanimonas ulmi TaxID=228973 RepID=A0A4Q7M229_9MICO|nr:cytochrome d ubiquinol oxidase subunit II [Xylanibacterium ulmi]RZS61916.1 cytochrome bd-I ubiquinol oxidase subunit 2 apoprotein [Xylanibacterium ulmi]